MNAQYEMTEGQGDNLGNCSETLKDLIRAMLVANPAEILCLAQLKYYLRNMQQAKG